MGNVRSDSAGGARGAFADRVGGAVEQVFRSARVDVGSIRGGLRQAGATFAGRLAAKGFSGSAARLNKRAGWCARRVARVASANPDWYRRPWCAGGGRSAGQARTPLRLGTRTESVAERHGTRRFIR